MMKTLMIALAAGALLVPAADAAPKNRQKRQGARIHRGVHNGSLTRPEAVGLGRAVRRARLVEGSQERCQQSGPVKA